MAALSILIITYNRPIDTLALLENLNEQQNRLHHVKEILLLNNASTESYITVEKFISNHPELPVQYVVHDKNLGVAGGRNFLIKKAKGDFLLVLDDDVVFEKKDAIETVAALFSQPRFIENNTAVITLNIFYYDTNERQLSAFPHKDIENYKDKHWFFTYYFTGAAHLMKRELFDKTGFYPEDFFYGMEEYDLSYRVLDTGYTLAYDDSVKVLHKESPTGRVSNATKLGMMWLNKSKVAWRYLPKKYFYSTAFMWSLEYLKKTGFNINGMFAILSKILNIPKTEKRFPISEKSLQYLKSNNARLWY
ncbi:glycosyltransferase family 2 protein [Taibaiella lutea]|uniref:Glycosyltransferase family 2 protein n=1 Tax=Taibaiella lutea TaxID=2608001 RepID=A0A5M6CBL7_9BACT|nr:glycosyltransferase family 2 protein [Taibaiella lutea]KAA5532431.1 glycosyltransferase family 2 protein [Taibaiella lutea]